MLPSRLRKTHERLRSGMASHTILKLHGLYSLNMAVVTSGTKGNTNSVSKFVYSDLHSLARVLVENDVFALGTDSLAQALCETQKNVSELCKVRPAMTCCGRKQSSRHIPSWTCILVVQQFWPEHGLCDQQALLEPANRNSGYVPDCVY